LKFKDLLCELEMLWQEKEESPQASHVEQAN